MIFLGMRVEAKRWPWQKGYNWRGMENSSAPLNSGGARFGGGWGYKLGVDVGGSTVILNLLFGMVRISRAKRCVHCGKWIEGPTGKLMDSYEGKSTWDMHRECASALADQPGYNKWTPTPRGEF